MKCEMYCTIRNFAAKERWVDGGGGGGGGGGRGGLMGNWGRGQLALLLPVS